MSTKDNQDDDGSDGVHRNAIISPNDTNASVEVNQIRSVGACCANQEVRLKLRCGPASAQVHLTVEEAQELQGLLNGIIEEVQE